MFAFTELKNVGDLPNLSYFQTNELIGGNYFIRMDANSNDLVRKGTYNIKMRWESLSRGAAAYYELDM